MCKLLMIFFGYLDILLLYLVKGYAVGRLENGAMRGREGEPSPKLES